MFGNSHFSSFAIGASTRWTTTAGIARSKGEPSVSSGYCKRMLVCSMDPVTLCKFSFSAVQQTNTDPVAALQLAIHPVVQPAEVQLGGRIVAEDVAPYLRVLLAATEICDCRPEHRNRYEKPKHPAVMISRS